MADILKEVIKTLPEGKIDNAAFEGANIVLYTKDKDFFFDTNPEFFQASGHSKSFYIFHLLPQMSLVLNKTNLPLKIPLVFYQQSLTTYPWSLCLRCKTPFHNGMTL